MHRLKGAVEADEAYIGGHTPGRLGRGVGKTGVAIAIERRARGGSVRLAVIPRATTAVPTSFVYASVQPDESTVFTDAWGAYVTLRDLGIDHRPHKGGRGRQSVHLLPRRVVTTVRNFVPRARSFRGRTAAGGQVRCGDTGASRSRR